MRIVEPKRIPYPFVVRQVQNPWGRLSWEAEVPELPGCVAGSNTVEGLVETLWEVLDDWIAVAKDAGQKIPEPSIDDRYSGRVTVRMPSYIHRRLAKLAKLNQMSLNSFILAALSYRAGELGLP